MMKPSLALLSVLAASSTASAQPQSLTTSAGYVSLGGIVSLDSSVAVAGYQIEGGVRLGAMPLYGRGVFEAGVAERAIFDDGEYVSGRLGLELRLRWLFLGADAGMRRGYVVNDSHGPMSTTHFEEGLVIPRVGIDVGGAHLRGRFAAELPIVFADNEVGAGVGVTAALSYAF